MRILHINSSDIVGGAARGTYWLHRGLLGAGVDSRLMVALRQVDDPEVLGLKSRIYNWLWRSIVCKFDQLPQMLLNRSRNRDIPFSSAFLGTRLKSRVNDVAPDLVNLHWICDAFVRPESLRRIRKPIVWTLRDVWSFSGGCHVKFDCKRYTERCGKCPVLRSKRELDLSRIIWLRKQRAWRDIQMTIVAPSRWMADCAKASSLLGHKRIEMIHHGIDETIFAPIDGKIARHILGLPHNKKLLLFGTLNALGDYRKGFDLLKATLPLVKEHEATSHLEIVVIGAQKPQNEPSLGFRTTYLGTFHDDVALRLAYSAAGVMVVHSREEAFCKSAVEALACGTPVVSFDTTGLRDIVEHEVCGYRAACFDVENLANGILWVLEDAERRRMLSKNARQRVVDSFTLKLQVQRYIDLYSELLEESEMGRGSGQ